VKCPDCKKENYLRGSDISDDGLLKKYDCRDCKTKFSLCPCDTCPDPVYLKIESNFSVGVNRTPCPSCNSPIQECFKCNACGEISVSSDICKRCPPPRIEPLPQENSDPSSDLSISNTKSDASSPKKLPDIDSNDAKKPENSKDSEDKKPTCSICYDKPAEMAFVPCGHKATCEDCGNRQYRENGICSNCREPIIMVIKIYD
jgi:hypothetical protein